MNDIAFKVIIKNDGIDDIIFKTIMLKGEKGDKGDAGETEIDDSTTSATKTWSSQKIDSMIAQTETIEDVAIASFSDGADDVPVSELIVDIKAVQAGSGVPSPDNRREILGFDSGVVPVCGKNLLSLNNVDFTLKSVRYYTSGGDFYLNGTSTGETSSRDESFRTNLNFLLKAGTYYFSRGNLNIATYLYDYEDNTKPAIVTNSGSFTLTEDTRVYIGFYVYNKTFNNLKSEIMINVGSSATTYEAYNGNNYTFTFGQTVYGGHFDNKGNLVVTHRDIDLGSLGWQSSSLGGYDVWRTAIPTGIKGYSDAEIPNNILCEQYAPKSVDNIYSGQMGVALRSSNSYIYCSRTDNNTPQGKLIAELTTPITLSITSRDVATLLGNNNIFANTGNINKLVYFKTGSEAVARMIEAYMRASN